MGRGRHRVIAFHETFAREVKRCAWNGKPVATLRAAGLGY